MSKDRFTSSNLSQIWGKADKETGAWHPLLLHMLDVAAVADVLTERLPIALRDQLTKMLGFSCWGQARPWVLWLVASHDVGKISPGFQSKWKILIDCDAGLSLPSGGSDSSVNHGFVTQNSLISYFLKVSGRGSRNFIRRVCAAVGGHHGVRAKESELERAKLERACGNDSWLAARQDALEILAKVLGTGEAPAATTIDGSQYMLLAGLTSFSDWVGSNTAWFCYGSPGDCEDLPAWFAQSRSKAGSALDFIGLNRHAAAEPYGRSFRDVFGFEPRPLQKAVSEIVAEIDSPAVMLLEAPMGDGKTEAALFAFLDMQRRLGHRGVYLAMPSMATGNAMFDRALSFFRGLGPQDFSQSLMLAHSASALNDSYDSIRISGVCGDELNPDVYATDWFASKNRVLLAQNGVGTVDQILTAVLPIRHQPVRLWGLANKVVVIDEVHAYDEYTSSLIFYLVRWLLGLGSSVILLSATLPAKFRLRLSEVVGCERTPELSEAAYPRLTVYEPSKKVAIRSFPVDVKRKIEVAIEKCGASISEIKHSADGLLEENSSTCVLLNTVSRAQALYEAFGPGSPIVVSGVTVGKMLPCGLHVHLFHARYMAKDRREREEFILREYGKHSQRTGRKLLIATQVVEQSLDVDFDAMLSDVAPLDLLLQRLGRLWRHLRANRPFADPRFVIAGLSGEVLPDFKKSLASFVYQEHYLARTWYILHDKHSISLPDEIDELVRKTYDDVEITGLSSAQQQDLQAMKLMADGGDLAKMQAALHGSIGAPDDGSWENQRERFFDEDSVDVHHSLVAKTRLGRESVSIIPVFHGESADSLLSTMGFKGLAQRMLSVSKPSVVHKVKAKSVSKHWSCAPVVGRCFPVEFSEDGAAVGFSGVRYDDQLGLVFSEKQREI